MVPGHHQSPLSKQMRKCHIYIYIYFQVPLHTSLACMGPGNASIEGDCNIWIEFKIILSSELIKLAKCKGDMRIPTVQRESFAIVISGQDKWCFSEKRRDRALIALF